jgi:hypothetical protein
MTADYADWLCSNPALDLGALVERHGGYERITPEAWAEHDRAMADWHERRRRRARKRVAKLEKLARTPHLRPCWRRQPTAKARQVRRPDLALRAASQSLAGLRGRVVR